VIEELRTLLAQLPKENAHLLACVFRHAQAVVQRVGGTSILIHD